MKKILLIVTFVNILLLVILSITLLPALSEYMNYGMYEKIKLNMNFSKVDISNLDEHGYIKGSYSKWRDNDYFSYKNYSDTPNIDSIEFYQLNKEKYYVIGQKKYDYCTDQSHTYPELTTRKLIKLANTNPRAAFDLHLRGLISYSDLSKLYNNLAEAKHLAAIVNSNFNEHLLDDDELDKYSIVTPMAVYEKYKKANTKMTATRVEKNKGEIDSDDADMLIKEYNEKILDLLHELQNADSAWLMAFAVEELFKATGEIDNDTLCEAYYRGCNNLYNLKVEHNIKCADTQ